MTDPVSASPVRCAVDDGTSVTVRERSVHFPALDPIRGVAALSVLLFHFTAGSGVFGDSIVAMDFFRNWGWAGVEAFFVVSGFVVPWAFHQFGVTWTDCMRFYARRFLRLAIPVIAACILIVGLNFFASMAPGFRGEPWKLPAMAQVLCNMSFSCELVGQHWFNPVMWTLAVEVQFYALVAVSVPLFAMTKSNPRMRIAVGLVLMGLLAMANFWIPGLPLFHYLPIFALGFIALLLELRLLTRGVGYVLSAMLMLIILAVHGWVAGMAALLAFVAILVVRTPPRFLVGLGLISYSLYLVHVPIGGKIMNLGARLEGGMLEGWAVLLVALAISLSAAWLFWKWVERPSQAWARRAGLLRRTSMSGPELHS